MLVNIEHTTYLHLLYFMVDALCYKPESRGFETRRAEFFFNLPNSSSRTRPWGLLSL
jgi:hypothetical protein